MIQYRSFSKFILIPSAVLLWFCTLWNATSYGSTCAQTSIDEFKKSAKNWTGRTLVASASWCSSCKETLTEATKNPNQFVFIVAFDTPEAFEKVLTKRNLQSPCIFGESLVKHLGIDGVPWKKHL